MQQLILHTFLCKKYVYKKHQTEIRQKVRNLQKLFLLINVLSN